MNIKFSNRKNRYLGLPLALYLLLPSSMVWADGHGCSSEQMAFNLELASNAPADADRVVEALRLQHESATLCRKGKIEAGRAKLTEAVERLKDDGDLKISQRTVKKGAKP